jgi:hypothetical protein
MLTLHDMLGITNKRAVFCLEPQANSFDVATPRYPACQSLYMKFNCTSEQ